MVRIVGKALVINAIKGHVVHDEQIYFTLQFGNLG